MPSNFLSFPHDLPAPPNHLLSLPSSALQLHEAPRPLAHLQLIPSSATRWMYCPVSCASVTCYLDLFLPAWLQRLTYLPVYWTLDSCLLLIRFVCLCWIAFCFDPCLPPKSLNYWTAPAPALKSASWSEPLSSYILSVQAVTHSLYANDCVLFLFILHSILAFLEIGVLTP